MVPLPEGGSEAMRQNQIVIQNSGKTIPFSGI
jgi:hypothetical protein